MKKIIVLLAIVVLTLSLVACNTTPTIELPEWPQHPSAPQITGDMEVSSIHFSWHIRQTLEEEIEDVDYIFRGRVISERVDWLYFNVVRLVTITEFEVTEVFKGNLVVGDTFEIYQFGGVDESLNYALLCGGRVELAINEDFIVFAFCNSSLFEEDDERRYTFPNDTLIPRQAFYWVASEETGRGMAMDSLSSVVNDGVIIARPDNPFTLTREDLVRIAEENGHEVGRDIPDTRR